MVCRVIERALIVAGFVVVLFNFRSLEPSAAAMCIFGLGLCGLGCVIGFIEASIHS